MISTLISRGLAFGRAGRVGADGRLTGVPFSAVWALDHFFFSIVLWDSISWTRRKIFRCLALIGAVEYHAHMVHSASTSNTSTACRHGFLFYSMHPFRVICFLCQEIIVRFHPWLVTLPLPTASHSSLAALFKVCHCWPTHPWLLHMCS